MWAAMAWGSSPAASRAAHGSANIMWGSQRAFCSGSTDSSTNSSMTRSARMALSRTQTAAPPHS